jgi:NADPH-dependent glutamate synthase beta subunit-like oxidoreductase
MGRIRLVINGRQVAVPPGTTILQAARIAGIYIPALCDHPDLPPAEGTEAAAAIYQGDRRIENAMPGERGKGCGLCVVEVEGDPDPVPSCTTKVKPGMVVGTDSDRIKAARQKNLIPILTRHRHACLTCAQQEGCSRSQCSADVPENERCCPVFGHCELQDVVNYIGIPRATPKWIPTPLPEPDPNPLYLRDYTLCIGCTRCIRACRDLRGIEALGFVYDNEGRVQVGSLEHTLEKSGCRFCTACVEVCPTGALMDRGVRPGREEQDLVPCISACPVHIDVPGYLRLIARGNREGADAVIREKVPFPRILGRTCVHPCEAVCRRGKVNEPVAICALKRYAADGDRGPWKKTVAADTGRTVAVVGSGPAGLTAAFYLRKQGHRITLFESRSKPGGMMRYGIPRFRLPEELLDEEIRSVLDLGIDFRPRKTLGKDFALEDLREEGYDAIFLAVGEQLSRGIPLEGSDHPDVLKGVDFLTRVGAGETVELGARVIVVGGGNVAVDASLTALRCGARDATLVSLEKREQMPAHRRELERALAEGVNLINAWGPHRVLIEGGRVTGLELAHCVSVFDDQGVFNPSFDRTLQSVPGDQVILALGQTPDLAFLGLHREVPTEQGRIVVNGTTFETGMKGVYAGGDAAGSEGTIIHAVAAGRKAASSIDKALGGSGEIDEVLFQRDDPSRHLGRREGFASLPREKVPELDPEKSREGFEEVSLGYTEEQAIREAGRCLQCDLRLYLGCHPSPPGKELPFEEERVLQVPEGEGVFHLYDSEHRVLVIKGTADLRQALLLALSRNDNVKWFEFETDKMYTKRESELIQKHLQEHGRMPGEGGLDEDLF